ncbi:MAG: HU family DNA-binding protein [Sulfurovum sp.]
MTEKELHTFMAKKMNSTEEEAQKWIEAFNEGIYKSISDLESLTIRNFGKFYVRESSSGSIIFKFTPAKKMRSLVGYA